MSAIAKTLQRAKDDAVAAEMSTTELEILVNWSQGVTARKARAELAQLRAQAAELDAARTAIEQARELIDQSLSDAVAIVNMSDGYLREMAEHLANQLGAWLAAHPAPPAEQEQTA